MHDDGFDLPPLSTVLRESESKIMHIFDPNPSFLLSTIHIQRLTVYSREYIRTSQNRTSVARYQPFFNNATHVVTVHLLLCHSFLDNYIFKQPLTYNATHFEMVTNTSICILQNTFEHLRSEPQLSVFNHLRTTARL
jgi:hypothetical protein